MIDERAVDEAEVHDFGRFGEAEAVVLREAEKSVGAFEKFVADAGSPFASERRDIGDFLQMKFLRVVASNDHRESIFEAEWLGDFQVETIGVELLDAVIDGSRIPPRRFVEDSSQCGAGVFDVEVELTDKESFVDQERAPEIGFSNNGNARARFNVLSEEFCKHNLLGEKFGADDDFCLRTLGASRKEAKEVKETEKAKETEE
jgi:hypothetical protein